MALLSLIFPMVLLGVVLILDRVERRFFPQQVQAQQLAAVDGLGDEAESEAQSLVDESLPDQRAAAVTEDHAVVSDEEQRPQALFRVGGSTVWLTRPARSSRRSSKRRSARRVGRVGGRGGARRDTPWRHAA